MADARFLLAGLISISLLSIASTSFADVVQHYKQTTLCTTEELRLDGDVECHLNGLTVVVGKLAQSGTVCDVAYSNKSQRLLCENSVWQNYGDIPVHRRKRLVGLILGITAELLAFGAGLCWVLCRGSGEQQEPPPVNQQPSITCPKVASEYFAPPGNTSVVVTWPEPTATDPEQGELTPKLVSGNPSGSYFNQPTETISYRATDDHGNIATCNINFNVIVKRCNNITNMPGVPRNGNMKCTPIQNDPVLGTNCSFSCHDGYKLSVSSSKIRTCKNDGNFDGKVANCSKIQCHDLGNLQNGEKQCTEGNYYNSVCTIICSVDGYESDGNFTRCQSDGQWTAPVPSCKDKRAPYFTFCPVSPVRVYADKGKSSATVIWTAPTATDNSGNFTVMKTLGQDPGREFDFGTHSISYVARDYSGNESPGYCRFDVVVERLECDSPDGKFDDDLILPDCPGTEYTYGTVCNVSCIRNYEIIGNTTITCEREGPNSTKMIWDWGGGEQPTCDNKCPAIQPPANGAFVCQTAGNEYCRLSCNVAFGYPSGTSKNQLFICTDQQLWDPPEADDCTGIARAEEPWVYLPPNKSTTTYYTERRPPDANTIGAELHYFVGDCNDSNVQSGLKDKFLAYMIELVNNGWSDRCPNDTGCIRDTIKVICGPVTARRRRESMRLTTGRWRPIGLHPNVPSRAKRTADKEYVITLDFKLQISWVGGTSADDLKMNDQELHDMINAINNEIKNRGDALLFDGVVPAIVVADTYPDIECPFGQTPNYYGDVPNCEGCATGKYYEAMSLSCAKCPVGTYQNETHQTTCMACPTNMSTKESGRKNISECFPVCAMGSYSASGVIPCTTCPVGEYQPKANSKSCNKCDVGKTTFERGQISSQSCTSYDVVLTYPGHNTIFPPLTTTLETLTLMFWMKCPTGNVTRPSFGFVNGELDKSKNTKTTIHRATNGWTQFAMQWTNTTNQAKLMINSVNVGTVPVISENIAIIGSFLSMVQSSQNGDGSCRISGLQMTDTSRNYADLQTETATCSPDVNDTVYNMENYKDKIGIDIDTPSKCDEFDECAASPCGVHICENLLNGYRCYCKSGYTGENCEHAPDFCVNNQCKHAATCISGSWNYTCACADGFRGTICEEEIECDPVGYLLLKSRNTKKDFCVTESDYRRCRIICKTGIVNPPLDYYECGTNTSYKWNGIPPSCAASIPAKLLTIGASVAYTNVLPCGREINQVLETSARKAQCVRNHACTMSVSTKGCSSRRRRDTTTTAQISFSINLEELQDFNLTALLEDNIVSSDLQTYITALAELEQTAQEINNSVSGFFELNVNNVTYNIDSSTFDISGVITCPNGSIANDGACVQCPAGTREENGWCVFCDIGTYQNLEGETECLVCPDGYTTQFMGMIHVTNCSAPVETTVQTLTDDTTTPLQHSVAQPSTTRLPGAKTGSAGNDKGLLAVAVATPMVLVIVIAIAVSVIVYFKVRKNTRKRFREQFESLGSSSSINMVAPTFPTKSLNQSVDYTMLSNNL